jgi:hypothetical protein
MVFWPPRAFNEQRGWLSYAELAVSDPFTLLLLQWGVVLMSWIFPNVQV